MTLPLDDELRVRTKLRSVLCIHVHWAAGPSVGWMDKWIDGGWMGRWMDLSKLIQKRCSTHPDLHPGLISACLGDCLWPFGDETLISIHGRFSLGHRPSLVWDFVHMSVHTWHTNINRQADKVLATYFAFLSFNREPAQYPGKSHVSFITPNRTAIPARVQAAGLAQETNRNIITSGLWLDGQPSGTTQSQPTSPLHQPPPPYSLCMGRTGWVQTRCLLLFYLLGFAQSPVFERTVTNSLASGRWETEEIWASFGRVRPVLYCDSDLHR